MTTWDEINNEAEGKTPQPAKVNSKKSVAVDSWDTLNSDAESNFKPNVPQIKVEQPQKQAAPAPVIQTPAQPATTSWKDKALNLISSAAKTIISPKYNPLWGGSPITGILNTNAGILSDILPKKQPEKVFEFKVGEGLRKGTVAQIPSVKAAQALKMGDTIIPATEKDATGHVIEKSSPFLQAKQTVEESSKKQIKNITMGRYQKDFAVGVGGTAKSMLYGMEWLAPEALKPFVGDILKRKADQIGEWQDRLSVENPTFADALVQGAGSVATFFIPGLGVAKGTSMLANVSPRLALLFGNSASTALEAMSEAGTVYDDNRNSGKSQKEASDSATKTFWANAILIGLTNKFGAFSDTIKNRITRSIASAPMEGLQGGVQQMIQNYNSGKPITEGAWDSAVIGGILGVPMGYIGGGVEPEVTKRYIENKVSGAALPEKPSQADAINESQAALTEQANQTGAVDPIAAEQLAKAKEEFNAYVEANKVPVITMPDNSVTLNVLKLDNGTWGLDYSANTEGSNLMADFTTNKTYVSKEKAIEEGAINLIDWAVRQEPANAAQEEQLSRIITAADKVLSGETATGEQVKPDEVNKGEVTTGENIKETLQAKYPNVDFSIYEKNGEINLSKIVVPKTERGKGIGTSFMKDLADYADRTGKRITLTPSRDFGGSKGRLTDFYKRFGFVENKGRSRDFSTRESMIRPTMEKKAAKEETKADTKPAETKKKEQAPAKNEVQKKITLATEDGEQARHEAEILTELEMAEPGYRMAIEQDNQGSGKKWVGVPSTFPDWLPTEFRKNAIIKPVLDHLYNGTLPTKAAEVRFYDYLNEVLNPKEVEQAKEVDFTAVFDKINESVNAGESNYYETPINERQLEDLYNSPLKLKFKKDKSFTFSDEKISSPSDVAYAFRQLKNEAVEKFYAVALKGDKPVAVEMVSMGTLNASLVHPREVLAMLINKKADGAYFVHNHPSGDPTPSADDIEISKRLIKVLKDTGITYKGHVVIDTTKFSNIDDQWEVSTHDQSNEVKKPTKVSSYTKYVEWVDDKGFVNNKKFAIMEPKDIYSMVKGLNIDEQKNAVVFYLNSRNHIITAESVPLSSLNIMDNSQLLKNAVSNQSASVAIGNFPPDPYLYKNLTNKFRQLGIELIDGVSFSDTSSTGFYSYRETVGENLPEYSKKQGAKSKLNIVDAALTGEQYQPEVKKTSVGFSWRDMRTEDSQSAYERLTKKIQDNLGNTPEESFRKKQVAFIQDFINGVPAETLKNLDFNVVVQKDLEALGELDRVYGLYKSKGIGKGSGGIISIFTKPGEQWDTSTFHHEFAHHYFEKFLTADERATISKAWDKIKTDESILKELFGDTATLTAYAKQGGRDILESEMFSRLFERYTNNKITARTTELLESQQNKTVWQKIKAVFNKAISRASTFYFELKAAKVSINESVDNIFKKIYEPNFQIINGKYTTQQLKELRNVNFDFADPIKVFGEMAKVQGIKPEDNIKVSEITPAATPEELKTKIDELNKVGQKHAILRRIGKLGGGTAGAFVSAKPWLKKAAGVAPEGEIRVKGTVAQDAKQYIETVAHELGHAIDYTVNGSTNQKTFDVFGTDLTSAQKKQLQKELVKVTIDVAGAVNVALKPRYYGKPTELLARFFEKMIASPGNLEEMAPLAVELIERQQIEHPIIRDFLEAAYQGMDKGQMKYVPLRDLRETYQKYLGKRVGDIAYGEEMAHRSMQERGKFVIEKFITDKFKDIKDAPDLLFKAAESIKSTSGDQPIFGTRDFITAKNDKETAALMMSGWEPVIGSDGKPVYKIVDEKEALLLAKTRYTKEQSEAIYNQLSEPGKKLIREFTAEMSEAKDLFNRNVIKDVYKINSDIEGWVHHFFAEQPGSGAGKGLRFRNKKASAKNQRTGAEGFVEDFKLAMTKALTELEGAKQFNEFIRRQFAMVTKPLAPGSKPDVGWVEVQGDIFKGVGLPQEKKMVIIKDGKKFIPKRTSYQMPKAVYERYKMWGGMIDEATNAVKVINSLNRYWRINVLTHIGSAMTNFFSGGIQYGSKVLTDFYTELLTGNVKMEKTRQDVAAMLQVLLPKGWSNSPDWIYGADFSNWYGSFTQEQGKFDQGLDAYADKALKFFGAVERYWKKTIVLAEKADSLNSLNEITKRGLRLPTEEERQLLADVNKEIDLYAYDYDNVPMWLEAHQKSAIGQLIKPFAKYPYKYAKHILGMSASAFDQTLPWQERAAKIMSLATLMALYGALKAERDKKRKTPEGNETTPARLAPRGRLYLFTDKQGYEVYLRTAKYPFFNLTDAGLALTKGKLQEANQLLSDLVGSIHPAAELALMSFTNYENQYDRYLPMPVKIGNRISSFVPMFRVLNDISTYFDPYVRKQTTFGQTFTKLIPTTNPELQQKLHGNIRTEAIPVEGNIQNTNEPGSKKTTVEQPLYNYKPGVLSGALLGAFITRINPDYAKAFEVRSEKNAAKKDRQATIEDYAIKYDESNRSMTSRLQLERDLVKEVLGDKPDLKEAQKLRESFRRKIK